MAFADLAWEDLKEWAGAAVVGRGKSYRSAVEDLRLTADGKLLAWVQGGDQYATVVSLSKAGKLASVCTCPYAIDCKHAVAMVLRYLEALKSGETIPVADDEDERLKLLADAQSEDDFDEDDVNEADDVVPFRGIRHKRPVKRKSSENPEIAVRRYLDSLSHPALVDFVRELAHDFPDVHQRISDRAELRSGDVAKLVANTRCAIEAVSAEPGWTRHWSDERHIPDYSRVKERLESLLASGHPDEVLILGETLLEQGISQVEMSNDEGETGQEVATCMDVVFCALKSSSKTGAERLLWEIDARLRDDYNILDGISGPLADRTAFTPADWSAVADNLAQRIDAMPVTAGKSDIAGSSRDYRRQAIMRQLMDALKEAGREREITAILTREAEVTHCYVELVDHLLADKQDEAAAEWARTGFERTIDKLSGIAWSLEDRLRNIAARKKDKPLVAAFRAMEFFDCPGADKYSALRKAVESLGLWDAIRPMLLAWLETGSMPDETPVKKIPQQGGRKAARLPQVTPKQEWPLPSTGLRMHGEKGSCRFFPDTATLIDIAIMEGRNEDALRWYDHAGKRGGYWQDNHGEAVAYAVQETHPDAALEIWKRLAKTQIAMKKPAAYQVAGVSLAKMKAVYQRTGRSPDWERLLLGLRAENARKPRMIEVLDGLEGKRSRILKA